MEDELLKAQICIKLLPILQKFHFILHLIGHILEQLVMIQPNTLQFITINAFISLRILSNDISFFDVTELSDVNYYYLFTNR